MLGRTDPPHVREAMPAVVLLVATQLEAGWLGLAALPRSGLRAAWRTVWGVAVAAIVLFTGVRVGDALTGGAEFVGRPTVLRSKSPTAFRIASDMQRAGVRRWIDLPRIGGLWLSQAQADQVVWLSGELARRTTASDPLYAAPGAEGWYFLADRVAANRFPVSMHGVLAEDQATIAGSLGVCRAVVTDSTLLDDRPWSWWLPAVDQRIRRHFTAAGSRGAETLSLRK
jgi:hypothetical protein